MGSKLNWERSRQTNRVIGEYSRMSFANTMERETTSPTAKQKKYFKRLIMQLKDKGEKPNIVGKLRTRGDYYRAISALTEQLGIEDEKSKKFQSFGDYVGVKETMADYKRHDHKYSCPDCYHRFKSDQMYPCNKCRDRSCFREASDEQ